jgi:biotin transport system substrate-specific component
MAAGAWIAIPIGPVPITLQTFFIILSGFFIGSGKAFLAAALYVLAGILGFPVFAGGLAGPAIILGPTAGYALSFPIGALIAGLAKGKTPELLRPAWVYILWGALGTIVILLCGSIGLILNLKLGIWKALAVNIPFIPGDVVKLLAATLAARSFYRRAKKIKLEGSVPPGPEGL